MKKSESGLPPSVSDLLSGILPPGLWQQVASDVQSPGSHWHPMDAPGRPAELGRTCPEELDEMARGRRKDDRTVALAQWVNRATWIEGENEAKLSTLMWSLRAATEEGDHPAIDRLKNFMRNEYGVNRFEMSALEARAFCRGATRNYKACPRDWRRVGAGLGDSEIHPTPKLQPAPAKKTGAWEGW